MTLPRGGKPALARAFGRASESYDEAADIQALVARRLAARIARLDLPPHPRILELGCGTGFLTRHLRERWPCATLVASDLSEAMVRQCRRSLAEAATYLVMDAEAPSVAGDFDLVCSSLTFQWLEAPERSLPALMSLVQPRGTLAFATMAAGSFAEWQAVESEAGLISGTPAYPAPEAWRRHLPDAITEGETFLRQHQSGYDFLTELKRIGAHLPPADHRPASAGGLRRVLRRFAPPLGIAVSWHIAYVTATRPGSR